MENIFGSIVGTTMALAVYAVGLFVVLLQGLSG